MSYFLPEAQNNWVAEKHPKCVQYRQKLRRYVLK